MILDLKGFVNEEMSDLLIDFINECQGIEKTIYLSSPGGYIYSADLILDIINKNKDEIFLIAYNTIESAAFELFFKVDCKKDILNGTRGMLHFATSELTVNQKGTPLNKSYVNHLKEEIAKRNDNLLKILKLTPTEIKKYNKGEDVEFSHKRMKELLSNGKQ